jgi:hypothetical protein
MGIPLGQRTDPQLLRMLRPKLRGYCWSLADSPLSVASHSALCPDCLTFDLSNVLMYERKSWQEDEEAIPKAESEGVIELLYHLALGGFEVPFSGDLHISHQQPCMLHAVSSVRLGRRSSGSKHHTPFEDQAGQ